MMESRTVASAALANTATNLPGDKSASVVPAFDMKSIIKCSLDFSSLTTLLSGIEASQHQSNERLSGLESISRTSTFNIGALEQDVHTLQKDVHENVSSLGELRVALAKMRTSTLHLPTDFSEYAKKQDIPCSRQEWEQHKLQLLDILSRSGVRSQAEQGATPDSTEVATLKAEIAELRLSHAELAKSVRDMTNLFRNREDELRGHPHHSNLHHSNPLVATVAEKALPNRPGVVAGETAQALAELGQKQIAKFDPNAPPTPLPVAPADDDDDDEEQEEEETQTQTEPATDNSSTPPKLKSTTKPKTKKPKTAVKPAPTKSDRATPSSPVVSNQTEPTVAAISSLPVLAPTSGPRPSVSLPQYHSSSEPSASLVALTSQLSTLAKHVASLEGELSQVRSNSSRITNDLVGLREGFKDLHASMPVPFVAPVSDEEREIPSNAIALQPTMIAVSLQCDCCGINTAIVFCVHCLPGSQKLCGACDSTIHAIITPASANESSKPNSRHGSAAGSRPNTARDSVLNSAAKHLRLEISKTISPGSRLMSNDLSFIKNQNESHKMTQMIDNQTKFEKLLTELSERFDRHDLQFGSLAITLNTVDDNEVKLTHMEKELNKVRTKAAEQDRAHKDLEVLLSELKDRLESCETNSKRPGSLTGPLGAVTTNAAPQTLAQMSQLSATNNPVTAGLAKQLHTELDQHKKQTNHAFLDIIAKLETLQSVELDGLTSQLRHVERKKVDNKQFLDLTERIITLENHLRSLTNVQAFSSKKFEEHQTLWNECIQLWTCQHCDSNALATGGMCGEENCHKRICWNCSSVGRNGHISSVEIGGRGRGGNFNVAFSTGPSGNAAQPFSQLSLQAVLENSPVLREIQKKLIHLNNEKESAALVAQNQHNEFHQLVDMLKGMNLLLPNIPTTDDQIEHALVQVNRSHWKFGPSAALLLDTRTLSYYESLSDFFTSALPNLYHRLNIGDQRAEVFSDAIAKLERRNREFEVASRPFVEEKFNTLSNQIALLDKSLMKKVKLDMKRYEAEFVQRLQKEREEEKEKMGIESSLARVHFRCVACDQPVATQPGPMSKEYQQQLLLHNQQFHGLTIPPQPPHIQQATVGGFASAVSPLQTSAHGATSVSASNPAVSGVGVISTERGHMFIDPGQRTTLHSNTDSTVYRGREDTRISFTPAAPTDRSSATFQTTYTKATVTPSGTAGPRSVGRKHAKTHRGHAFTVSSNPLTASTASSTSNANAAFHPSSTTPILPQLHSSLGSLSARSASATESRPRTNETAGSRTTRDHQPRQMSQEMAEEEAKIGE